MTSSRVLIRASGTNALQTLTHTHTPTHTTTTTQQQHPHTHTHTHTPTHTHTHTHSALFSSFFVSLFLCVLMLAYYVHLFPHSVSLLSCTHVSGTCCVFILHTTT